MKINRRHFLASAAAALSLGGCVSEPDQPALEQAPLWFPPQPQPCAPNNCPYQTISPADALKHMASVEIPTDIPVHLRTKNYNGGSCYHASAINLLRFLGFDKLADWWRAHYGGGEYTENLAAKMTKAGVRFALCTNGDPSFLDWAASQRLPAAGPYFPSHAINFMYMNATTAYLLDNNRTNDYIRLPRQQFLSSWKNQYGGDALVVIGTPPLLTENDA